MKINKRTYIRQIIAISVFVLVILTVAMPTAQLAGREQGKPSTVATSRQKSDPSRARGRALIVGIEKYQRPGIPPTSGGAADARSMVELVQQMGWFKSDEIRVLTDEMATAESISRNFRSWLIDESKPGDQIFFYYSGHGTQVPDADQDERAQDSSDKFDEAIAPYDVAIDSNGKQRVITDDQFNHWLDLLAGRSVVMVFDSCHSGTVNRSLPNTNRGSNQLGPRYLGLEQLTSSRTTRSILDQNAGQDVVEDGPITRNLRLVVDEKRLRSNSLVTLISAAGSYQLAYPMVTPNKTVRGALTYFLETALITSPHLSVSELNEYIKYEIKNAQSNKKLHGSQIPHIEMNSPGLIKDKPLFQSRISDGSVPSAAVGTPTGPIAIISNAPFNPSSANRVTAQIGKVANGKILFGPTSFCIGESIGYRITSSNPGYFFMVVFSQGDKASLIYPTDGQAAISNKIDGQVELLDNFWATEPEGKDLVLIFVTKNRVDLSNLLNKSEFSWAEMRAELAKLRINVELKTRGIGVKPAQSQIPQTDWQVTEVESDARKCSGGRF